MNGNGKTNTIIEMLKTILASQVGGWVLACTAFAVVSYWTIQDRQIVYAENIRIRGEAMHTINEIQKLIGNASGRALENNEIIREAQKVTEDNNRILYEIRSYMNLPLENRSDLKAIRKHLQDEKDVREGAPVP